jgi:hypothetical protein
VTIEVEDDLVVKESVERNGAEKYFVPENARL